MSMLSTVIVPPFSVPLTFAMTALACGSFGSAARSVAADEEKWQTPPVDDLGNRIDAVTTNVYVEDRKIIIGALCQRLPVLDVGRLSNYAMP